ncbi:PTS sugar transporter subunit IIA [Lacticaseibacillus nasuensis]|uniref:Ascorbate-specific PTS system EIIA component n=1 Tax=Lacticaseibacillus nasuensis JCM 17158 TaxID=1291734 RepID=A0A0R1JZK5_9LACO|nr:PTS sugar transporter subunit IIA [Lacticaseibacillus nasuensis]KRK74004.1 phosphotransferase system mannitol fructose-specific IIA domain containing protein [Lacticaseibacillus nasuensis JCM 17158]MCX2455885.1 PTS sugar transporter subunit IIA [Lacticaseibacillus nasuensis]
MIEKMMNPALTQLNVVASDWRDAIHKAGAPLVKAGAVSQNYVEEIIHSVEQYGPYFVIAPHVALAHAPSDAGAQHLAMGITTLKPAVVFNNPDNDPVKYVFTLSAPDSNSHLKAMQELVELLSADSFYQILDQAQSPDEIMQYVQENVAAEKE